MKRRTYFFPEAQLKKLEKLSRKLGISVSEIIRRAIDNLLDGQSRQRK
jgi:metal-responsive CopG/Arc/MetJ family transcriptional regulator